MRISGSCLGFSLIFLFMVLVLVSGCAPGSGGKPVLSAAEIASQAESAISSYMSSLKISDEEVIFTVQRSIDAGKVTLTGRTSEAPLKQGLIDALSAIPGLVVVDKIEVLPPASMGDKVFAIVKVPVVDLGDGPNSAGGSHTVTQARMGDVLRLLDTSGGWYLAQMEDKYLGWIGPESIYLCDKATADSFRSSPVALVTAKTAPLLDSPGGNRVLTEDLVQGSVLPIASVEGEWVRVRVPGGSEGWLESSKIKEYPSVDEAFAEKKGAEGVIATAKQFLGLPYLWGGTTAYGFDCSGFTQFAMKMNGYRIRRDANMQYEQGDPVESREDLKPGDLVFFETYAKGASHVGIYLGDSLYIQSGSKGGVAILSFDPSHPAYSESLDKAYIGARRIIK